MEYISKDNSEDLENNENNEKLENESEEMYILDEDNENKGNLFDMRENAFSKNEQENEGRVPLRSSIKFGEKNNNDKPEELDEEYIDSTFWAAKTELENLDFLEDL